MGGGTAMLHADARLPFNLPSPPPAGPACRQGCPAGAMAAERHASHRRVCVGAAPCHGAAVPAAEAAVQQCYRVSPGPDFVLIVYARDMPDYLALAQRLFTQDANVRNVKAFFSIKRSKFGAYIPVT